MNTTLIAVVGLSFSLSACASQSIPSTGEREKAERAPDVVFVPTPHRVVDQMLAVARVGQGDVLYDLGSGDGRIVIAAARRFGIRAIGIDIDPKRISESRFNADTARVTHLVEFRQADLFTTDLRPATVVTLYLLPELNLRLRPKLFDELRPGSRVVSHSFGMGDWKADSTLMVDARIVYFWIMPADVSGRWDIAASLAGTEQRYDVHFHQQYQRITAGESDGGMTVENIVLTGDSIAFALRNQNAGDPVATEFRGSVSGSSMAGSFTRGTSSGLWRAIRRAATSPSG